MMCRAVGFGLDLSFRARNDLVPDDPQGSNAASWVMRARAISAVSVRSSLLGYGFVARYAEALRYQLGCVPNPDAFPGLCLREDGIVFGPCQQSSIWTKGTAFAVHQVRHAGLSSTRVPHPQSIVAVAKDNVVNAEGCKPSSGTIELRQFWVGRIRKWLAGAEAKESENPGRSDNETV
jgi:hypothetical protein